MRPSGHAAATREVRMMDPIEEKKVRLEAFRLKYCVPQPDVPREPPVFAGRLHRVRSLGAQGGRAGYDKKPRIENVDVPPSLLRAARYHKNRERRILLHTGRGG